MFLISLQQPPAQHAPPLGAAALQNTTTLITAAAEQWDAVQLLTPTSGEHLFFSDILLRTASAPRVVLVAFLADGQEFARRALALLKDPAVALLFLAPRHTTNTRMRAAIELPAIGEEVPRIIARPGDRAAWNVAHPGQAAPLWLLREARANPAITVSPGQFNAMLLGVGAPDPDLRLLLQAGVPALRLTIDPSTDPTRALAAIGRTPPKERSPERSYLLLPGANTPILSEGALVWSIAIVAIGIMLYAVLHPRRLGRYVRVLSRRAKTLLFLFAMLSASLVLSNLLLRLVTEAIGANHQRIFFAVGKFAVAFIVLALFMRTTPLASALTAAALLFLIVGAVIAGTFSIAMSAFSVLIVICGLLFSLAARPFAKALALLVIVLLNVYLVVSSTRFANVALVQTFITPPLQWEIFSAVFLFPLFLMVFRLHTVTPRIPLLKIATIFSTVTLLFIGCTIVKASLAQPTALLALEERYGSQSSGTLSLASSTPLANLVYLNGANDLHCAQTPCTRSISAPPPPFSLDLEQTTLLDRVLVTWRVNFTREARALSLQIDTDRAVQLYAANIPSAPNSVGSTARSFIMQPGPYPPRETRGDFVIRPAGQDTLLRLTVSAEFSPLAANVYAPTARVEVANHTLVWTLTHETVVAPP